MKVWGKKSPAETTVRTQLPYCDVAVPYAEVNNVHWDQIGLFWKILAKNFLKKVAQVFGNFLNYFENYH